VVAVVAGVLVDLAEVRLEEAARVVAGELRAA
jgi:hypothetical protein